MIMLIIIITLTRVNKTTYKLYISKDIKQRKLKKLNTEFFNKNNRSGEDGIERVYDFDFDINIPGIPDNISGGRFSQTIKNLITLNSNNIFAKGRYKNEESSIKNIVKSISIYGVIKNNNKIYTELNIGNFKYGKPCADIFKYTIDKLNDEYDGYIYFGINVDLIRLLLGIIQIFIEFIGDFIADFFDANAKEVNDESNLIDKSNMISNKLLKLTYKLMNYKTNSNSKNLSSDTTNLSVTPVDSPPIELNLDLVKTAIWRGNLINSVDNQSASPGSDPDDDYPFPMYLNENDNNIIDIIDDDIIKITEITVTKIKEEINTDRNITNMIFKNIVNKLKYYNYIKKLKLKQDGLLKESDNTETNLSINVDIGLVKIDWLRLKDVESII